MTCNSGTIDWLRRWAGWISVALGLIALPTLASAETRVALVIGESAYRNVAQLPNPVGDAQAIAASLKKVGFTVVVRTDLDKTGIEAALQSFSASARSADVALVYYAGHGVEVGGQNYLVPISATLAADDDVKFEAIPLDLVLSAVSGASQLKMVVLDACRDNPFVVTMKRTSGTRSVGRGLVRVEPDSGTLVAYAAREGSTAADGDQRHSPFTTAFMENLETPGLEIRLMFGKIHDDVLEATNRRQEPATYASLGGKPFYFVPGGGAAPVTASAGGGVDPKALERAFWNSIQTAGEPGLYAAYLRSYPNGAYAAEARAKVQSYVRPAPATTTMRPAPPRPVTAPPVEVIGSAIDGAWNGVYAYSNPGAGQKPVQFAMLLSANGTRLTGSVTEPNTFGDPSVPFLRANLDGRINGRIVSFTKTYDGTGGASHSVEYQGTLDPTSRTIRGQWHISSTTGYFELHLKER